MWNKRYLTWRSIAKLQVLWIAMKYYVISTLFFNWWNCEIWDECATFGREYVLSSMCGFLTLMIVGRIVLRIRNKITMYIIPSMLWVAGNSYLSETGHISNMKTCWISQLYGQICQYTFIISKFHGRCVTLPWLFDRFEIEICWTNEYTALQCQIYTINWKIVF